jgi:hypothetical protein
LERSVGSSELVAVVGESCLEFSVIIVEEGGRVGSCCWVGLEQSSGVTLITIAGMSSAKGGRKKKGPWKEAVERTV